MIQEGMLGGIALLEAAHRQDQGDMVAILGEPGEDNRSHQSAVVASVIGITLMMADHLGQLTGQSIEEIFHGMRSDILTE